MAGCSSVPPPDPPGADQWLVNEDGFISIGESILSVIYHSSLNIILVITEQSGVIVLDVTSGCILQKSQLTACQNEAVKCLYLSGRDKLLVSDGKSIGVRKDLNGIILLDTALQTPVRKSDDIVKLELPLQDASHLFKGLMSNDLPGVDHVEDVIRELEKQIENVQQATKGSHKLAKWATVTLQMPHSTMKNVFNILMMELNNMPVHTPDLPVAAAIYDRLTYLLPGTRPDLTDGGVTTPVDRTLMYSEAARADTFSKWPHMSYKWALPEPMGQAGFYHQPNGTGDDRAMCFTCSVCLVCWEPTDEPWSEHERHSPICPFVKGEYTQNVPLSVTYATEPAMLHGKKTDKIECISTSSCDDFIATSTLYGNVVVWDVSKQLKKHAVFNIDPYDSPIAVKTGSSPGGTVYDDTYMKKPLKSAWTSQEQRKTTSSDLTVDEDIVSESIEVLEIPLHSSEDPTKKHKRCRPSRDIQVTSLCIAGTPSSQSLIASNSTCNPALISGVNIKRSVNSDESKDVQLMNKVNEALSTELEIISSNKVQVTDYETSQQTASFVPYLLVHNITALKRTKETDIQKTSTTSTKIEQSKNLISDIIHMVELDYDSDCDINGVDVFPEEKTSTTPPQKHIKQHQQINPSSTSTNSCSSSATQLNTTVQCMEMPEICRQDDLIINSISLSLDKKHIIVVLSPRVISEYENIASTSTATDISAAATDTSATASTSAGVDTSAATTGPDTASASGPDSAVRSSGTETASAAGMDSAAAARNREDAHNGGGYKRVRLSDDSDIGGAAAAAGDSGGFLLVYRLSFDSDVVSVCPQPVRTFTIDCYHDAIKSLLLLPLDALTTPEEEESQLNSLSNPNSDEILGIIVTITNSGKLNIHRLDSFKLIVEIDRTEQNERFKSATFCTGMDRLCTCTETGSLYFYQLTVKGDESCVTCEHNVSGSPVKLNSITGTIPSVISTDTVHDSLQEDISISNSLLVKQPITIETLSQLHELTLYENLLPRFSATLPQCWSEIQQEQQQRRHPQHLQQQGEATQHTRTWRLQTDSTSWDEHLIELVLPRPTCVGHIDIRFTLHPMVLNASKIQVTLLKQNITNIGRQSDQNPRFNNSSDIAAETGTTDEQRKLNGNHTNGKKKVQRHNPVWDTEFLQKHNAEILCGPVEMGNYIDLSASGGLITLTSSALMKVKTKSFLIHIKALLTDEEMKAKNSAQSEPVVKEKVKISHGSSTDKPKKKISLFDQFHLTGGQSSTSQPMASTMPKVCPDSLKGCDCITEISITVRKSRKTSIPKDRLQRAMMVAQTSFHEQLVTTIFSTDSEKTFIEQKQSLALDILCWVTSVQINEPKLSANEGCLVLSVLSHLKELVKSCFLQSNRTIAHKCARLFAICMEYCKNVSDVDLAPNFNLNLLEALLDCLPLIVTAQSAGALHWYFTLLDRVKCMDINNVGIKCVELLSQLSQQYSSKISPLYSLLKSRYGLYGTPFDPELFDTEPPQSMIVQSSNSPHTYSSIVASNNNNIPGNGNNNNGNHGNSNGSTLPNDDTDFNDLLALINTDKQKTANQNTEQQFITEQMFGLLEVEPLHFTCHATSDGTRMERMDTGINIFSNVTHPSLQSSVNFGEGLAATVPSATGVALASLSSAMASAEQQLQLLQNKQQQLLKLQKKLGPGDKSLKSKLLFTLAQKAKLEQKLAESSQTPAPPVLQYSYGSSSELFPPTPKTTPLFMTPPMTPPNEGYNPDLDPLGAKVKMIKTGSNKIEKSTPVSVPVVPSISQSQTILQPPPPHVLVVERMHSGARRFVVLDFGKSILLTDILIPTCNDLASLSIDVWERGEEIDGRRLIVASDIGLRPLVMNDLTPAPICRYLKMTTIGRYGASTTRSRIPIGSFYGHTFILPWEHDNGMLGMQGLDGETVPVAPSTVTRPAIMSHMSVLLSLQEDILCRYSLARHRLESLLKGLDQSVNQSVQTKWNSNIKRPGDQKVVQTYNDCSQLQLQLNLAQKAVNRLQRSLGIDGTNASDDSEIALKQASLDKLRVLSEYLLKSLLSMTAASTAIPNLPASLYSLFDPNVCQTLFQNLCIHGTKHMQLTGGMLLVRMCGRQPWWGDFLGNAINDLFGSHQVRIIPQERVFVLLTTLGQKSLMCSNASRILQSLLSLLARLLVPLSTTGHTGHRSNGQQSMSAIDLPLISRLLVFLTKTLDLTLNNNNTDSDGDGKKTGNNHRSNDAQPGNNHWDFLLGDSAIHNSKSNAKSSTKMYRRKLHKRLMHHKQQLLDLQQAKKIFFNTQKEKLVGSSLSKETEVIMKQQEHLFKKQLKQYTSKHFKDIMHIRRTDAEILRKIPKDMNSGNLTNGDKDSLCDIDTDTVIVLPRDRCIPVVRGLVSLLLSMDFTCSTDLFLITCKVLARIVSTTRPAISLSEAMTQDQLEQFIMLCSSIEHSNTGNAWGGPWAVHSVTCLLLDILESERLYPMVTVSDVITDDDITASLSETDDSIGGGQGNNSEENSSAENNHSGDNSQSEEMAAVAPVLEEMTGVAPVLGQMTGVTPVSEKEPSASSGYQLMDILLTDENTAASVVNNNYPIMNVVQSTSGVSKIINENALNIQAEKCETQQTKIDRLNRLKKSIADHLLINRISGANSSGTSIAMDSRLEFGIELTTELRLKMMISMEVEIFNNALLSPLPGLPSAVESMYYQSSTVTDDEQINDAGLFNATHESQISSYEMLSTCFNHLVLQLPTYRVDLDTLLSLWLTMNDDSNCEEITFDSSRIPLIPLTPVAVNSLFHTLTIVPNISVRTWTLAFQALTWLTNTRCQDPSDRPMASVIMADSHLVPVLIKFLSGSTPTNQTSQVGPTTTQVFQSFLLRLSARCSTENETHLRELLLRLVYTLTAERGPFQCGLGPLDAQYRLLEHVLEQDFEGVDINNAISVITSICTLTKQHILSQERVTCNSSLENSVNPKSCFGGLFASMLCPGDARVMQGEATRDVLVCNLLKLVNSLIQVALPHRSSRANEIASLVSAATAGGGANGVELSAMTDSSKINQSQLGPAETDEQKCEISSRRSCSHYSDIDRPETETKEPTISDIILTHGQIMNDLIHSLNRCNSNTIALLMGTGSLGCNAQQACSELDPISVGDCIFQILSTLNRKSTDLKLIIRSIFDYFTSQNSRLQTGCHLSEPFLWILVGVLDCKPAFETFIELGGIEVICNNMVWSSKQLISTTPSFISGIMPYLCATKPTTTSKQQQQQQNSATDDTGEGLTNFAPQSTISSSNPSAGPADVLIQSFLPHRRARSAAWSYHFYPDEAWVDLHIQLSCAVLLKEVHIRPHLTSLATCPSSVSLEISRDGISFIPICPPQVTSGLMLIKLQLHRPEVASIVTLRLHKPRDSNTLGLSQIMLLGSTAFGDLSSSSMAMRHNNGNSSNSSDELAKTSMCWLRLLHHCLMQPVEMSNRVAERAAPSASLLHTCSAMLVSTVANTFSTHLETVLLKLGLHSTQTGLTLIDNLLRNPSSESVASDSMLPLYGKMNGISNEATVDILYQLGMTQDEGTATRVQCLMEWLGDNARKALQRNTSFSRDSTPLPPYSTLLDEGLPNPSSSHVHCVAAILWQSQELPVTYDLQGVITRDLFSSMYEWSTVLQNATLKQAVDSVISSMCHIQPYYLSLLMEWMGISLTHGPAPLSNDINAQLQSMTDDSKEACQNSSSNSEMFDIGNIVLNDCHLMTLAVACQSEAAIHQLLDSGFPEILCQSLLEFCTRQLGYMSESIAETDSAKTESLKRKTRSVSVTSVSSDKGVSITVDLVAAILNFLSDVSREPVMKDWLVSDYANIFWPVLMTMLCTNPLQSTTCTPPIFHSHKLLSGQQRAAVETATVAFFTNVTAGHSIAQHLFAQVLCNVVKEQGITQPGSAIVFNSLPLSGFTRRLFLQVLLEDEKIQLAFKSSVPLHKGPSGISQIHHPKFGAGHKHQVITVGLQTTCADIIQMIADTSASINSTRLSDNNDDDKDEKKDASELGIEVVDQISSASGIIQSSGMSAKEKRDLYKHGGSMPTMQRPPTRRGRPATRDDLFSTNNTSLSIYHPLIPGQALPTDMTLTQVLVLLHERGLPQGQSSIEFVIKPTPKISSSNGASSSTAAAAAAAADDLTDECLEDTNIPESILLETRSFPSALHVFASIGGLALLAEHLPLLYPEITRQVGPPEGARDMNLLGMKDDWVTVEYEADIFELDIESTTAGTSTQPSNRQSNTTLPSIPPHSLVAFGLFLRLPGYAEVLLTERKKAQCLLRLVLGVTDDGDGGHILTSPVASSLPTLPFSVLKSLFDQSPLTTDDGVLLRRMMLDIGAIQLILACLSVLSHHAPRVSIPGFHHEIIMAAMQVSQTPTVTTEKPTNDKSQHYWAKGTGFGTGSFTSSWDAEQALLRQKSEEEHVTCLLQVLASYINPGGNVPELFETETSACDGHTEKHCLPLILPELLCQSCLVPAISSYLRNDSVLDMARHVPLYKALLELLRGIAICPVLVPLLMPIDKEDGTVESACLSSLLSKMKSCVDTYASRLKTNSKSSKTPQTKEEDDECEGLALLIPDIQKSASLVETATLKLRQDSLNSNVDSKPHSHKSTASHADKSLDDLYMSTMKELQFDTFEMIEEEDSLFRFKCPHHYESNIIAAGEVNNAPRARRLAQEAVTLSTSLPLSASSSVFVRCDEERLDVMKVLITGPSDTPYANGCFILDVYFPHDYPNSPPLVNLETTGNHTVRFNPNLYNDGKVCLSILNTWHGRPEEKWNSQTSSFLQVLVSVQSLILVSEPYFNEPGYERSRGTLSGTASSREYDANIKQATVKWAMLEMLRNPDPCFKQVIHKHFWLKRHEIIHQIDDWISDLEQHTGDKRFGRTINHSCLALKRHYNQLKEEFAKMKTPSDLEDCDIDLDEPAGGSTSNATIHEANPPKPSLVVHPSYGVVAPQENHLDQYEDEDWDEMSNWNELPPVPPPGPPPPPPPGPAIGQSLDTSNDDSPTSSDFSDSSTATPKVSTTAESYLMNSTLPPDVLPVSNDIGYDEVDFC